MRQILIGKSVALNAGLSGTPNLDSLSSLTTGALAIVRKRDGKILVAGAGTDAILTAAHPFTDIPYTPGEEFYFVLKSANGIYGDAGFALNKDNFTFNKYIPSSGEPTTGVKTITIATTNNLNETKEVSVWITDSTKPYEDTRGRRAYSVVCTAATTGATFLADLKSKIQADANAIVTVGAVGGAGPHTLALTAKTSGVRFNVTIESGIIGFSVATTTPAVATAGSNIDIVNLQKLVSPLDGYPGWDAYNELLYTADSNVDPAIAKYTTFLINMEPNHRDVIPSPTKRDFAISVPNGAACIGDIGAFLTALKAGTGNWAA